MSGEQIAMWRKLLLVILLLGIGYLIWRRMQNAGGSAPVADLSAKPPTPVPSAPPPSPVSSPPASTPSATGSTPRPVVTRIHRGAPPSTRRSTAPPSGDAASARRNGVDSPSGKPAPETAAHAASVTTPGLSETAGSASSLPETARDQGTIPAETTPVEANISVATITKPNPEQVATSEVTISATTMTETTSEQAAPQPEAISELTPSDFTPIDINRADREALLALPGIGPVLAERIIAYREAHGPFKSVDELTAISGIGERNINIFRKLVYVDPNG